jgi:hypothetical protein
MLTKLRQISVVPHEAPMAGPGMRDMLKLSTLLMGAEVSNYGNTLASVESHEFALEWVLKVPQNFVNIDDMSHIYNIGHVVFTHNYKKNKRSHIFFLLLSTLQVIPFKKCPQLLNG